MSKKRIQVLVEPELYSQIESQAKESGLSLSSFLRSKIMESKNVINGEVLLKGVIKNGNNRNL